MIDFKEIVNSVSDENKDALEALGSEQEIIFTKDDLLTINKKAIDEFGGIIGVRDENLLDSVSKAPYQSAFGMDMYDTPFKKAAKYLFDFAKYQIFLDGNKRTGYYTCLAYLRANNIKITLAPIDLYNLTMNIANNKINEIEDVCEILENNYIYEFGNTLVNPKKESEENTYEIEQ